MSQKDKEHQNFSETKIKLNNWIPAPQTALLPLPATLYGSSSLEEPWTGPRMGRPLLFTIRLRGSIDRGRSRPPTEDGPIATAEGEDKNLKFWS